MRSAVKDREMRNKYFEERNESKLQSQNKSIKINNFFTNNTNNILENTTLTN